MRPLLMLLLTGVVATADAASLDKRPFIERIRQESPALRACYESAARERPDLSGRLVVQFSIESNGETGEVLVTQSTLEAPALEDCVRDRFASIRFTVAKGFTRIRVSYPLVFKPAAPQPEPTESDP